MAVTAVGTCGIPSMRPPHCAGEIVETAMRPTLAALPFNEAPALRGGNRNRQRG